MASTTTLTRSAAAYELQTIIPVTPRVSHELVRSSGPGRTLDDSPASPARSSNLRIASTVLQLASINLLSSFSYGAMTVGLPTIARDINLERELYLWPLSVSGLTCGSMLLLAGSITDVIGPRRVELVGCALSGVFILACGLANTGIQLTIFRALQGGALAIHLPAAVSIVTQTVPKGKARNISFAALGFARDIGYSIGLVVSGVLIQTSGWRLNFYLAGGATLLIGVVELWCLPDDKKEAVACPTTGPASASSISISKQLWHKVDWVGTAVISAGLALLAYVLAVLSADLSSIHSATTTSLLATSLALLLGFPVWMNYQQRRSKPALIPNYMWRKTAFTSTCVILTLSNGGVIAMELFSSLYFQEIQHSRPLATSLQLLPNVVVGVVVGLTVGLFIHKLPARWLVTIASTLCACAPLLMALMSPDWSYWYMAFWAQALSPLSVDVLFTVGMLIVSESFEEGSQALAGAVFNTVGNFGMSLGVGVCQLVALGVTGDREHPAGGHGGAEEGTSDADEGNGLLKGYRAGFWTMHGLMIVCSVVAVVGLKRVGKLGLKRD